MRAIHRCAINCALSGAVVVQITAAKPEEQQSQGQTTATEAADMLAVQPYEGYDLIGKMRLSAAYFVNPTLVDQAELGYFVSAADLDDGELAEVEQLIQDGEASVSVMMSDGKFYKLVDPSPKIDFHKSSDNVGVILDSSEGWRTQAVPVVSWGNSMTLNPSEVLGTAPK